MKHGLPRKWLVGDGEPGWVEFLQELMRLGLGAERELRRRKRKGETTPKGAA